MTKRILFAILIASFADNVLSVGCFDASPLDCLFEDGFETQPLPPNQLSNPGFEAYSAGNNPPYDPPSEWLSFGVQVTPYIAVGYNQFATQAHGAPIYEPSDPSDQSNLFPGHEDSRALKMWGRSLPAEGGTFKHTLGTIYQEFGDSVVPAESRLTLSGWAFISSVDPLGADNKVYLVIKCFPLDFSEEYCGGGGGRKSTLITNGTTQDSWLRFSVTVESLDARATYVQAGVEFEQCASGGPCATGQGSVFWDAIHFYWE